QVGTQNIAGTSVSCTPSVPAAYNGAFPGAIITGPSSFTYPLAQDPGQATVKGQALSPGGPGTGIESLGNFTAMGGNASPPNLNGTGLPKPLVLSGEYHTWDPNGWNSEESWYVGNPTAPLSAPGNRGHALYNVPKKQAYIKQDTDNVL